MLADARNECHLSQERAAELSDIPKKALAKYEVTPEDAPPERILKLSETYRSPEILEWYCTDVCPVGKNHHCKMVMNDLTGSVLSLINEMEDVKDLERQLRRITCDGQIKADERADVEKIMVEVEHLERAIHGFKAKVAREITRLEKEKTPVLQHRRIS